MGRIAALGAEVLVQGLGLAGVLVFPAATDDAVRSAWRSLPDDIDLVILTQAARRALDGALACTQRPLVAVMPS